MKNFLRAAVLVCSLAWVPAAVCADSQETPFTLPAGSPTAALMLPDGTGQQKISVAVSQALVEEEWQNLNWDHEETIASMTQSHVNLKIYVISGATDVKLYIKAIAEKNMSDDKLRKMINKLARSLERTIAEKLKLDFHQAKGEETMDSASAK